MAKPKHDLALPIPTSTSSCHRCSPSGGTPFCDETNDICAQCLVDGDCDDSLFCNGVETCSSGTCQAGPGNPCSGTTPTCDEANDACICTTNADCDDGTYCNGVETCNSGSCQTGTTVDCNDGFGCTVDSCNEATDSCDNTPVSCPYPQACTEPTGACENSCDVVRADDDYLAGFSCFDTSQFSGDCSGIDTLLVLYTASTDVASHRTAASGIGFRLAEPRTSALNTCYRSFLSTSNEYFIGATDSIAPASEGNWYWESGGQFWAGGEPSPPAPAPGGSASDYENWNSGEPNDAGGAEDCAVYTSQSSAWVWNDVDCNGGFNGIYELI